MWRGRGSYPSQQARPPLNYVFVEIRKLKIKGAHPISQNIAHRQAFTLDLARTEPGESEGKEIGEGVGHLGDVWGELVVDLRWGLGGETSTRAQQQY